MSSSMPGVWPGSAGAQPSSRRAAGWEGRLELSFDADGSGTRLVRNRHAGPLRLLKALLSEDARRLEAVIVHPPGGLVGGDSLLLHLRLGADARVLATTPGAQKWYRADMTATSDSRVAIGPRAMLEWLPQPAILFDRAMARQSLALDLDASACCIGWEILVRGRQAMGEVLRSGHLDQTLSIAVGGVPLWRERLHAEAADRLFDSPLGWDGRRIAASVWCCAPAAEPQRLRDLRDRWRVLLDAAGVAAHGASAPPRGGATVAVDGLLLAKVLADDGQEMMSLCRQLWGAARMSLEGCAGSSPRIWRT